jgi:hypothetical protein
MLNIVNPLLPGGSITFTYDDFSHMFYWVTSTKSSKVDDNDTYKIFVKGRSQIDITQNRFLSHNRNVGSNSTIVEPYSISYSTVEGSENYSWNKLIFNKLICNRLR